MGGMNSYPEKVKWFSIKGSKDKARNRSLDNAEYLEEEEIKKVIGIASSVQRKTIISSMYESGASPEEFLLLQNTDLKIDSKGAVSILRGKTGERSVSTFAFVNYVEQWLEIHPLKNQDSFPGGLLALGLAISVCYYCIIHKPFLTEPVTMPNTYITDHGTILGSNI